MTTINFWIASNVEAYFDAKSLASLLSGSPTLLYVDARGFGAVLDSMHRQLARTNGARVESIVFDGPGWDVLPLGTCILTARGPITERRLADLRRYLAPAATVQVSDLASRNAGFSFGLALHLRRPVRVYAGPMRHDVHPPSMS